MVFVSDQLRNIIINVVIGTFPSLNSSERNILIDYLVSLINFMSIAFNFDETKKTLYENQFTQNDHRDLIALLLILLPFITNDDDGHKKKQLKNFDELYLARDDVDITKESPDYVYTNTNYGRCYRKPIKERSWDNKYIAHNYYLFLETIRSVSSSLYVNWIDVLPIPMTKYKETKLYLKTKEQFDSDSLDEYDLSKGMDQDSLSGLSIEKVYDTISNDLYYGILKTKWLIYDIHIENTKKIIPMIIACTYLFPIKNIELEYFQLSPEARQRFDNDWKEFLNVTYTGDSYTREDVTLTNDNLQKIARSIIYTFDYAYDKRKLNDAIKNNEYKPFNIDRERYDEDDYEDNEEIGDRYGCYKGKSFYHRSKTHI